MVKSLQQENSVLKLGIDKLALKQESFEKLHTQDMKVINLLLTEILSLSKQTSTLVIKTKTVEEQQNIVTWEQLTATL